MIEKTQDLNLSQILQIGHCNLKVASSQAIIYENFSNYFPKTKANKKFFIVVKCTWKGLKESINELER